MIHAAFDTARLLLATPLFMLAGAMRLTAGVVSTLGVVVSGIDPRLE